MSGLLRGSGSRRAIRSRWARIRRASPRCLPKNPRLPATFSAAPKVLMASADVASSELLGPGNRATWRLQVAGERAQEYAALIKPKLGPGQRLETIRELRPEVRSTLERSEQFLGLAASFAVFLAVVAIVLALRRYLKRELDTATLFHTLGAGQRQTLMHFVGQFFLLALIACVLGVALAFAAQAALAGSARPVRLGPAGGRLAAAGEGVCHRTCAAARFRYPAAGCAGGDAAGTGAAPRHANGGWWRSACCGAWCHRSSGGGTDAVAGLADRRHFVGGLVALVGWQRCWPRCCSGAFAGWCAAAAWRGSVGRRAGHMGSPILIAVACLPHCRLLVSASA